jgi:hypothetical protein
VCVCVCVCECVCVCVCLCVCVFVCVFVCVCVYDIYACVLVVGDDSCSQLVVAETSTLRRLLTSPLSAPASNPI